MNCTEGFLELKLKIMISLIFRHSVVSACLQSPSLKNLLICPVATSSAEHAGKGKSYFGLACEFCVSTLISLHLSSSAFFCVYLIAVYNVCMLPQVSKSKDPRG